ncbi:MULTISPECIES: hypothetical protein [Lachnospiraceae]|nr:hypothetical protein [Blautia producta]
MAIIQIPFTQMNFQSICERLGKLGTPLSSFTDGINHLEKGW